MLDLNQARPQEDAVPTDVVLGPVVSPPRSTFRKRLFFLRISFVLVIGKQGNVCVHDLFRIKRDIERHVMCMNVYTP